MNHRKTFGITSNELKIHLKIIFSGKVFLGYYFYFLYLFFLYLFLVNFSFLISCSFFFPFSFFNISPAFIFSTIQLFLQHCLFAPMKVSPFAEMIPNSFPFLSNGFCFHQNLFKLMKLFPTMISSSFPVLPDGFV